MNWRWALWVGLAVACGPSTSPGDGSGSADGGTVAATGDGDGDGGTGMAEGADDGSGEGIDDGVDDGLDDGEVDTGDPDTGGVDPPDCVLAIRIDQCCNQAYPATPEEVAAEDCVVLWPPDFDALPPDLASACIEAQPEFCQIVDCDYTPPASEVVELNARGECVWVCPEKTSIGYTEPGCGEPPPFAQCLPPPPPCADEYCSCEGETIYGCGQTGEPHEHMGACE